MDVHFCETGTIRAYSTGEEQFWRDDHVFREIQCGVGYGTVILGDYTFCSRKEENPPQAILGRATKKDAVRAAVYKSKEWGILLFCWRKTKALRLDMKVVSIVSSFWDDKVSFFFSVDTRVDFRILVKELGIRYRRRTELRQVDARSETELLGGMGNCGRSLCCYAYLLEFIPAPVEMAKEQGLALNLQKISGACGCLMRCLKHKTDAYAELNRTLPWKGGSVQLSDNVHGDVVEVSVLKQMLRTARYVNGEGELRDVAVVETTIIEHKRKGMPPAQEHAADVQREKKAEEAVAKQREGKEKPGERNGAPQQERTQEKKK